MEVNFNNLRIQALISFNELSEILNNSIDKETGHMELHANNIEKEMMDLRSLLCAIACVYEDNRPEFVSVIDEVKEVKRFNDF